jgi:hypothetical protein
MTACEEGSNNNIDKPTILEKLEQLVGIWIQSSYTIVNTDQCTFEYHPADTGCFPNSSYVMFNNPRIVNDYGFRHIRGGKYAYALDLLDRCVHTIYFHINGYSNADMGWYDYIDIFSNLIPRGKYREFDIPIGIDDAELGIRIFYSADIDKLVTDIDILYYNRYNMDYDYAHTIIYWTRTD